MTAAIPRIRIVLAAFILAALVAGCAVNPVTGRTDLVLISEAQEIELGRTLHQEVVKQYGLYDDPELASWVSAIGERLAAVSHRPDLIFRFYVLDSPQVNAFALPGGYIYLTRGILAHFNSEAEMAGVLGHEIGHVTARHSVRQHSSATIVGVLATMAAGRAGDAAGDLSNILGTAIVRGYGREHELEADRLGAEYLARVGYEPDHMIGVIDILGAQEEYERRRAGEEGREPRLYHGLFATHPEVERRRREVIEAARRFQGDTVLPENRDPYLARMEGMVFGPGEREGVVRGRDFFHRPMDVALRFPEGWRIENLPDRLRAHAPEREALIQVTVADLGRRESAADHLSGRFGEGKLERRIDLDIAGGDGHAAVVRMDTPYGRRPVRVAAVVLDNRAWLFLGATESGEIGAETDRLFLDTAGGLRRLRADEFELAAPYRISLTRADAKTTMAALARKSPIPYHAESVLRLINGLYPEGEPESGQLIKIIE